MPKAAIIFNPVSARLARLRGIVADREAAAGWEASDWIPTTDAGPVDALVDSAIADGATLIVAAGGDGTVRSVASAVAGRDLPLAIVPVGTANLLARNLGIPLRRLRASVAIAFSGTERPLDLGTIDYVLDDGGRHSRRYFVMAGFGIDSDMVAGTDPAQKARLGWLAYVAPILRSLRRESVDTVTYSLDQAAPTTTEAHSFVVGNSGRITAGLRLLPAAALDDGKLDVLVLRSMRGRDRGDILRWFVPNNVPLLRAITPSSEAFRYTTATNVEVSLDTAALMQADGDLLGRVASARFTVTPSALNVRVPARSSARSARLTSANGTA